METKINGPFRPTTTTKIQIQTNGAMKMNTTKQNNHEEEQRASSSCQEDQASGCQAPGSPVEELRQAAMSVLIANDPLLVIQEAIRTLGYGGDIKAPMITYLAATSRVLGMRPGSMPVHLLLMGPPSAGKSYTLQIVLRLLPEEVSYRIDAGSLRVLIYDQEANDLRHRIIIFSEADSLPKGEDNPAASALRTLMQENRLNYKVTITDASTGRFGVQEISKLGPSVVITTSTRRLGPQLDSRVFTLEVSDSSEQIQAALMTQAQLELEGAVEPDPALIAFQALLQIQAPWEAWVPFASKLAEKMGLLPQASRINRDFLRPLSLVKSLAVLRHQHREKDEKNRIVAQIADYEVVYQLVNEMFETSVNKVSDKIRQVVQAVDELKGARVTPISITAVGDHLGTTKQAAHYSIKTALSEGWLVNTESRRGYPFNLDIGEPLPGSIGLPPPKELEDNEAGEAGVYSLDTYDTPSLTPQRAAIMSETGGSQNLIPFRSDGSPPWEETYLGPDDGSRSLDRHSSAGCYDSDYFDGFIPSDEFCSLHGGGSCPRSKSGEHCRQDIRPDIQDIRPDINETSPEDIVF